MTLHGRYFQDVCICLAGDSPQPTSDPQKVTNKTQPPKSFASESRDVTDSVCIDIDKRSAKKSNVVVDSDSSDSDDELQRLREKRRESTTSARSDARQKRNASGAHAQVSPADNRSVTTATVHTPPASNTVTPRRNDVIFSSDTSMPTSPLMTPAQSSEMIAMQALTRAPSAFKVVTPASSQPNTRPSSRGSAKSTSHC